MFNATSHVSFNAFDGGISKFSDCFSVVLFIIFYCFLIVCLVPDSPDFEAPGFLDFGPLDFWIFGEVKTIILIDFWCFVLFGVFKIFLPRVTPRVIREG